MVGNEDTSIFEIRPDKFLLLWEENSLYRIKFSPDRFLSDISLEILKLNRHGQIGLC